MDLHDAHYYWGDQPSPLEELVFREIEQLFQERMKTARSEYRTTRLMVSKDGSTWEDLTHYIQQPPAPPTTTGPIQDIFKPVYER